MEKQNKHQGKKDFRLFLSLFLPYFLIVIFVGGINLILTFRIMSVLEHEAVERGSQKAETIRSEIMLELYENLPVLASLENSYQIIELSEAEKNHDASFYLTSYHLQNEMLKKLKNANYLAVYLPDMEYLVTTQYGYDHNTLPLFLEYTGISKEELDSFLKKKYSTKYLNTQHSWITSRNELEDGRQVLVIADYQLLDVIRSSLSGEDVFALSYNDSLIYSNNHEIDTLPYEKVFSNESGRLRKISGSEYVLVSTDLPLSDLKMAVGIPIGAISGQINIFRKITLWIMVGLLVFGLFLSVFQSAKLFQPMRDLARLSASGNGRESVISTLRDAGRHISSLRRANFQIQREMEEITPLLLGKKVLRLADTEENGKMQIAGEIYEILEIDETEPVILFSLCMLEDLDGFFVEDTARNRFGKNGKEFFFLNNFLNDLIFIDHKGMTADMDGYYTVIAKENADFDVICHSALQLEELCREYLHISVRTTEVLRAANPMELIEAISKTNAAVLRILFFGTDTERLNAPETNYSSYTEKIRQLLNLLATKEYSKAQDMIDSLITMQLPGDERDINKAIYRMHGTISIITAATESQTSANWENIGEINDIGRLYHVKNLQEFREESKRILSELIRFREAYQESASPDIVIQAKNYIDIHYMEGGLNVSMVADALGVTDSYLSRMFRSYLGCNLLEYIQRKRVDKAKELLKTESVKETANMIGLWDTQALIRLFKKYEGITPGAYEEQFSDVPVE